MNVACTRNRTRKLFDSIGMFFFNKKERRSDISINTNKTVVLKIYKKKIGFSFLR